MLLATLTDTSKYPPMSIRIKIDRTQQVSKQESKQVACLLACFLTCLLTLKFGRILQAVYCGHKDYMWLVTSNTYRAYRANLETIIHSVISDDKIYNQGKVLNYVRKLRDSWNSVVSTSHHCHLLLTGISFLPWVLPPMARPPSLGNSGNSGNAEA